MNEIEHVFITKEDCQRIYDGCDLGDSVNIRAYQFPHAEQIPRMNKFVEQSAYEQVVKGSEVYKRKLAERTEAWMKAEKERDELVRMNMGLRCKLAEEEQQIRHLGSCHGITQLNIALEALKFYAEGKHLTEKDHEVIQVIPGSDEYIDHIVGKKAREAIAKIEGTK
jgi:hypothetical protein